MYEILNLIESVSEGFPSYSLFSTIPTPGHDLCNVCFNITKYSSNILVKNMFLTLKYGQRSFLCS